MLVQKESKVYYGTIQKSDMQGPCPDGFHVPTYSEFSDLVTAFTSLNISKSYFYSYLKIPLAGYRNGGTSTLVLQNSYGYYWTCTAYGVSARGIDFTSSDVYTNTTAYRGSGMSIRAFKDTPVVPDSSWTVIYQGSGTAGIFYNSGLGIISISSNGTKWITIRDRNEGAIAVYNSGDTLSQNNCGCYYQWGNNYGFAWTGSIATSSTTVDASTYGPGNYYSGSTYITTSGTPYDWCNPQNDNLWGGVSEGTYDVHKQIRPSPDYLCFTAKHAGAQVRIIKTGSPTPVTLETSRDKITWSTYTFGTVITLSNLGDKLYWRNTSETTTGFSTGTSNYYRFFISEGAVGIDGDVTTLINKNGTDTLVGNYCFYYLFYYSDYITSAPRLPATTLTDYCYYYMFANTKIINTPSLPATTLANNCYMFMFRNCTELTALPKLPALVLTNQCYNNMFNGCSKIMLYNSAYGESPYIYRIPTEGSGTDSSNTLINMFANTGGYFTGTPYINTNYYITNPPV